MALSRPALSIAGFSRNISDQRHFIAHVAELFHSLRAAKDFARRCLLAASSITVSGASDPTAHHMGVELFAVRCGDRLVG